jgi:hypothetical protein
LSPDDRNVLAVVIGTSPNEFWAAIPDRMKNQTQVGRYNLGDFSFKPLLVVHIAFDSMSM